MCAKKAKIFNTEKTEQTEIKKLKRIFQSMPSLFALFSLVNLFWLRLVRVMAKQFKAFLIVLPKIILPVWLRLRVVSFMFNLIVKCQISNENSAG